MDIGHEPDDGARRCGDAQSTAQNVEGAVQQGAGQGFHNLRLPEGRQFQGERHGILLQKEPGQEPCHQQGYKDPDQYQKQDEQRRRNRLCPLEKGPSDEDGGESDQHGKPAVARHKAVRHHCGQPLPPGGDDPASRHAHRVASKSHTHGKSLFAAGSGTFEAAVQIKGQPREIAQILQQGKEREKDGHGWL